MSGVERLLVERLCVEQFDAGVGERERACGLSCNMTKGDVLRCVRCTLRVRPCMGGGGVLYAFGVT